MGDLVFLEKFAGKLKRPLFIAHEHTTPSTLAWFASHDGATCLSNRWDIFETGRSFGLDSVFSDFDFGTTPLRERDVLMPLAKERAVNEHVIETFATQATKGHRLILWGEKNSGIKNYGKKPVAKYGLVAQVKKIGKLYCAIVEHGQNNSIHPPAEKNYHALQTVQQDDLTFITKPGIFGWNKVDRGSRLLIDTLYESLDRWTTPTTALDLGCGWGYLSISLGDWFAKGVLPRLTRLDATDNNAAALLATKANLAKFSTLESEATPGNCGQNLTRHYDWVLCNPPFHKGQKTDRELTSNFAQSAAKRLSHEGVAFFVVNQFIPLPKVAGELELECKLLSESEGFRVYAISKHGQWCV